MNRIRTGATEPIYVYAVKTNGKPFTGLTDIYVRLSRVSDGKYLDWSDMTFKSSGHTTKNKVLSEVDPLDGKGLYRVTGNLNTSLITNPVINDTYTVIPIQTPGTNAKLPGPDQIQVGDWVDAITNAEASAKKIDELATLPPSTAATGSLLDRLVNKDAGKTYDQTLASLEAIRTRVG